MSKLAQQTLYAIATTSINTVSVGSAFDLTTDASGIYAKAVTADFAIDFALIGTTAPASGTLIRLQGRLASSGNWLWRDLATFTTNTTAAVTTTINGGTSTAGSTSITTTGSATFGARSKDVFFYNTGTLDQSEWAPATGHVTTTLTLSAGLRFTQANSTAMYDQCQQFQFTRYLSDLNGLRLIVDNNRQATGSTVIVRALFAGWS